MPKDKIFNKIVEAMIDTEDESGVTDIIVEAASVSSDEDGQMSYLLKFEEYLDDLGVYTYEGWEDTVVLRAPEISKFWFQVDVKIPDGVDLEFLTRVKGRHNQNKFQLKKTKGNSYICRMRILRSELDAVERENRREAEKIAKSQGGGEQVQAQPQV